MIDSNKIARKVVDLVMKEKGNDYLLLHQDLSEDRFDKVCDGYRQSKYVDAVKFCKSLKIQGNIDPNKHALYLGLEGLFVRPIDEIKDLIYEVVRTPMLLMNRDELYRFIRSIVTPSNGERVIILPIGGAEKFLAVADDMGVMDILKPMIYKLGPYEVVRLVSDDPNAMNTVLVYNPLGDVNRPLIEVPVQHLDGIVDAIAEDFVKVVGDAYRKSKRLMRTLDKLVRDEMGNELK